MQRFHYSRPVRKEPVDPNNEFAVSWSISIKLCDKTSDQPVPWCFHVNLYCTEHDQTLVSGCSQVSHTFITTVVKSFLITLLIHCVYVVHYHCFCWFTLSESSQLVQLHLPFSLPFRPCFSPCGLNAQPSPLNISCQGSCAGSRLLTWNTWVSGSLFWFYAWMSEVVSSITLSHQHW